jgi:O-methyltransferase involved in polyketide biosynthesis
MAEKTLIELGDIQKTLLLPLWGRALETGKTKPVLTDKTAFKIISEIDYDFSVMAKNISPISQYAWIVRSLHTDRFIREFLIKHPGGTVVNIGCGLDTTFDRIDNGALLWYDLDLPDVISLRKKFIKETERRKFIACSFLDNKWFEKVNFRDGIVFIASGVLYYFDETEVKDIFIRLADKFAGSEIFFDAASPMGVRVANKKVITDGGMNESAFLKWGIERLKDIESWDSRLKVIEEYPMFYGMKKGLSLKMRIGTLMSDYLKIMSMVRVRIG